MNIDVAILTETKLTTHHIIKSSGYDLTITEARSNSIGGVALCVRESPWFHVEGTKTHGHNVVSTQLVSGRKRWLLIGIYIPPSETDGSTIQNISSAARDAEKYKIPILLMGDLNVDLVAGNNNNFDMYNDRHMATWALIQELQLHNLGTKYVQPRGRGDWTWHQQRNGIEICKTLDYALVSHVYDYKYHKIKIPRMDTDHRMIVVGLKLDSKKQHHKYVNNGNN